MLAIELVHDRDTKEPAPDLATAVVEAAAARGLLLLKAGIYGNCIRVLVPLVISDAQLDEALDVWEEALDAALHGSGGHVPMDELAGDAGLPHAASAAANYAPGVVGELIAGAVRARGGRRLGRDGVGLPRARPDARAAGRGEDPPRPVRLATRRRSSASSARRASAAQLAHPNIVTVIDRGEDDGRPYIVFEYVEGENLKQLVTREGALPVGDGDRPGHPDRAGARGGARARRRPPRREAAERPARRGGAGQGDRLRHRPRARHRGADADRDDHGHERLHRPRAGEGRARRARRATSTRSASCSTSCSTGRVPYEAEIAGRGRDAARPRPGAERPLDAARRCRRGSTRACAARWRRSRATVSPR